MKKSFGLKSFIVSLAMFAFNSAAAQQPDELQGFQGFAAPKPMQNAGILKFSLIPIFVGQIDFTGELRVTYERKIAKHQSITIGVSYDYPNFILLAIGNQFSRGSGGRHGGGRSSGANLNSVSVEGGRITFGYRYYPLKKQPGLKGFFIGPWLSYNAANIRDKSASQNYELVNYADACAITGYQLVVHHFALEFFGGFGYKNNFVTHPNADANQVYRQFTIPQTGPAKYFKFALEMNFGYAF